MSDELDYAIFDRTGAARAIFYPRGDHSAAPPGAEDYLLEVGPGVAVGGRLYTFDPARPVILYFHGNGEVASDYDDAAASYHDAGANLFVVEFRGYGASNGQPTFATLVGDAHPAAGGFHAVLDELGFTGARFVMGRSLGSHPALEVAAHAAKGFEGLIIESGAANLRRLAALLPEGASRDHGARLAAAHEAKVRAIRLPALIIHGEQDELIPVAHAAELYGLLDGTERELLVIPGAGHNDLMWVGYAAYFAAIRSFVARRAEALGPT